MAERHAEGGDQGDSAARAKGAARYRRDTEQTMLRMSGEVGYRQTAVSAVVRQSGSNLTRFYGTWTGKADCYLAAYIAATEELEGRLLTSCREASDWTVAIRRGLLEFASFTAEDPALAAGVIAEVHVAGGAALERRRELVGRLAFAIDRGRRAAGAAARQPPVATPAFIVASIEAAALKSFADHRPLRENIPGLLFLAVASYQGPGAAWAAIRGWPSLRTHSDAD